MTNVIRSLAQIKEKALLVAVVKIQNAPVNFEALKAINVKHSNDAFCIGILTN